MTFSRRKSAIVLQKTLLDASEETIDLIKKENKNGKLFLLEFIKNL